MMSIIAGLGGSLIKQLAPAAINWGMRKLTSSNLGKQYVPASMVTGLGQMLKNAAVSKGQQWEKQSPVGMYMTQQKSQQLSNRYQTPQQDDNDYQDVKPIKRKPILKNRRRRVRFT